MVRFTEYLAAQFNRTEMFLDNRPLSSVVGAIDAVYETVRRGDHPISPGLARIFSVCHQGLFSAASCIARGIPLDSPASSRRALEAARVALAIKLDPANAAKWAAFEGRMARWDARDEKQKAPKLNVNFSALKDDPLADKAGLLMGILSDVAVHFTPEYLSNVDFTVVDGGSQLYSDYIEDDQDEIARYLRTLVAVHMTILKIFDRCVDGAFLRNPAYRAAMAALQDLVNVPSVERGTRPPTLK